MIGAAPADAADDRLVEVAGLAQRHVGLDAVIVFEFLDNHAAVRALCGDAATFGLSVGDLHPLVETYCAHMVAGEAPRVIRDVALEPAVAHLQATAQRRIGAYVGVPLRRADGSIYGSLCCLSRRPEGHLDDRDARFLELLADTLVNDLSEQHRLAGERDQLLELIRREDFDVAYQPVVSLETRAVLGVEALSRFRGVLLPEATFAAAVRHGVGLELERLAIRKARSLTGALADGQWLSVNASPEVALHLARRATERPDLQLERLVVEITENASVASYPDLRAGLAEPRRRGLRVAVDDAGAGYASLRHVLELQPDIIKIDRVLVDGVAADRARRVIVGSFVILAMDLGATIVAEGVESVDDLHALEDLAVDAVQGYLLARPSTDPTVVAAWVGTGPDGHVRRVGEVAGVTDRPRSRPRPRRLR